MLDTLAPARRRLVLLVVLGALVAVVAGAAVLVVRATTGRVRPVAQDVPGPVLLVSGYGGSTRSLEPLRTALERAGRDVVVVPPVEGGTGDIEVQAESLGRRADAAMQRFDAVSVDVVGYSAGGVVARSWVRDFGGGSAARRVLSVGSPQHGTSIAELAVGLADSCPTACRQLEPDSSLLRALNARDETPRGPAFVSVWSDADEVVVPGDSARLDGALNLTVQSVCPGSRTAHGGLPGDPVVQALLRTALGAGAATRPNGVDCGSLSSARTSGGRSPESAAATCCGGPGSKSLPTRVKVAADPGQSRCRAGAASLPNGASSPSRPEVSATDARASPSEASVSDAPDPAPQGGAATDSGEPSRRRTATTGRGDRFLRWPASEAGVCPGSTASSPRVDSELPPGRPRVPPGSTASFPRVDSELPPGRWRVSPGSMASLARVERPARGRAWTDEARRAERAETSS